MEFRLRYRTVRKFLPVFAAGFAVLAVAPGHSRAASPTLTTLVSFGSSSNDGAFPYAGLIVDVTGNLFGTTKYGGLGGLGDGTVFEIVKTSSGYASSATILVSFNEANGAFPYASLVADDSGNLFGTTASGGMSLSGTVFEVAKTSSGYASTPSTLFNFTNDAGPYGGLTIDANDNLFGTTYGDGVYGNGAVFEITASGYANLVSFGGGNGGNPFGALVIDADGNLFGTTVNGGGSNAGTVFEIIKTPSGYASTPTVLVSFDETNGANPFGGLIIDASGNLFGTTVNGGGSNAGTAFEILKTSNGYANVPTTLVNFNGTNGANPYGGLIADANGNLFGTTYGGGVYGAGTVFEIAKTASGYAGMPSSLVSFNGSNNANPYAGLIADRSGNLFGTTLFGGPGNEGTAFEITGSGFVVSVTFAGTPGRANCFGQSISVLAGQYGGLNNAASALGYSDVSALRSAVLTYCGG